MLRPKLTPHGSVKYAPDGSMEVAEKVVDHETLLNKQLQCSVVFNVRDIFYMRGHDSIPTLLARSCIVLKVEDSGDIVHAKSTIVTSFLKDIFPDSNVNQLLRRRQFQTEATQAVVKRQSYSWSRAPQIRYITRLPTNWPSSRVSCIRSRIR